MKKSNYYEAMQNVIRKSYLPKEEPNYAAGMLALMFMVILLFSGFSLTIWGLVVLRAELFIVGMAFLTFFVYVLNSNNKKAVEA